LIQVEKAARIEAIASTEARIKNAYDFLEGTPHGRKNSDE
jgi:Mn-dependent DtxR family transcriptional regulator